MVMGVGIITALNLYGHGGAWEWVAIAITIVVVCIAYVRGYEKAQEHLRELIMDDIGANE